MLKSTIRHNDRASSELIKQTLGPYNKYVTIANNVPTCFENSENEMVFKEC